MPLTPPHPLHEVIAEDGVAVMRVETNTYYLYTIGNTDWHCPELLLFCPLEWAEHYRMLLRDLAQAMQMQRITLQDQTEVVFQNQRFQVLTIDHPFIAQLAEGVVCYYAASPVVSMVQLVTRDHYDLALFDEPCRQHRTHPQPLLRCH